VRVWVIGYEKEAVVTGSDGAFRLPAHEVAGSIVVIHAEKDGFQPTDQQQFAGPDSARIRLSK
jgi:hypothetical protein